MARCKQKKKVKGKFPSLKAVKAKNVRSPIQKTGSVTKAKKRRV